MLRAAGPGGDGAVHGRGASADDRHTALERVIFRRGEQVGHLDGQVLVLDAQLDGLPQSGGDADGIVALREKCLWIVNACAGFGGDGAERKDKADVLLHHALVEAMVRDQVQHAAELVAALEDVHLIAHLRQGRSGSQTGRSSAHHGDLFPVERVSFERRNSTEFARQVDERGLDTGDLDGPIEALVRAGRHAEAVRADLTADTAQRVIAHDLGGRALDVGGVAHPGGHDEVKGGTVGGTGLRAGLLLAVFTAEQFRLKLVPRHHRDTCAAELIHCTPRSSKFLVDFVSKNTKSL